MFDPTQPAQQTRPTSRVAQPNKKCWTTHNWTEAHHWAQCYSLNNWIFHWCKVSSFHWSTLMQAGAQRRRRQRGHNSPGARKVPTMPQNVLQYSTFASEKPQVRTWGRQTCFLPRVPSNLVTPLDARYPGYYRSGLRIRFYIIVYLLFYTCIVKAYNTGLQQWCDWRGYNGANLPPNKLNEKIMPPFYLYFGVQYTFLVFSKLLFYAFFGSFWTVIFGWFRVSIQHIEIHIRINSYLQTFFWTLARGPLPWPVSLFQLYVSQPMAKTQWTQFCCKMWVGQLSVKPI